MRKASTILGLVIMFFTCFAHARSEYIVNQGVVGGRNVEDVPVTSLVDIKTYMLFGMTKEADAQIRMLKYSKHYKCEVDGEDVSIPVAIRKDGDAIPTFFKTYSIKYCIEVRASEILQYEKAQGN